MEGPIGRLGRLPLGGLLIALIPTVTLWQRNMNRLGYEHVWATILFVCAVAAGITGLLYLLLRSGPRSGLLAALVAAFVLYSVPIARTVVGEGAAATAIVVLIGILSVAIARKIPAGEQARSANGKLNLLLTGATLVVCGSAALMQFRFERARPQIADQFAPFDARAAESSPDVWHILLDRYASRETLAARYAFDNRPFLDALRARGFWVGEGKYSNYQRTAHSVAGTLNGSDLDRLAASTSVRQNDWVPIYRAIADNRAGAFFAANGYHTVFAGTWWSPTRRLDAQETINYRSLPQLGRQLLDQSAVGLAMRSLGLPFGDGRMDQCRRETYKFDRLEQLAAQPTRKYIFAHFLVPHPPFVFAADGRCRTLAEAKSDSRRDNYVAQVQYANLRVLRLIDAIRAGPRPAVIVLHSDEGPWPEPYVGNEHSLGGDPVSVRWDRVDPARLREKMGILLAVRSPSGPPRTRPDSPVQIYPAILHDHFGGSAALPSSTHQVFESDARLYRFHDVEAVLGSAQAE